jgi:hypothetical protein
MTRKRHGTDEIIRKLREAEVLEAISCHSGWHMKIKAGQGRAWCGGYHRSQGRIDQLASEAVTPAHSSACRSSVNVRN